MINSPFMSALRGETPSRLPIWLMRQAGRYLPEYLKVSAKHSFLEMCHTPELAVEISLQPIKRFDLDAAILFSDILTPLIPMGVKLDYLKGQGPVIANPIRTAKDVIQLKKISSADQLGYIREAVSILKKELPKQIPLLGFCGSPFTLASYMIEGGSSKSYSHTFKFFNDYPVEAEKLLNFITEHVIEYLLYKADCGVDAVQVFESTGGALSRFHFEKYAFPHLQKIFKALNKKGVPNILYILNGGHVQDLYAGSGCKVASLDWRIDLTKFRVENPKLITQGNLNPSTLFGGPRAVQEEVSFLLEKLSETGCHGHIFNLGHGILPEAPIASVEAFIDMVHKFPVR
jgi:uroporphyrinogen decarboxylase